MADSIPAAAVPMANGDAKKGGKSRSQLKKLKKKAKRANGASESESEASTPAASVATSESEMESEAEVEQLPPKRVAPSLVDQILSDELAEAPEDFRDVFQKFKAEMEGDPNGQGDTTEPDKGQVIYSDDDAESENSEAENLPVPSKRKQRKHNRVSVADLKRLVRRPEVVEWVDVSAPDPRLLVALKSYRNVVPIPQHWSAKRDYLSAKRGLEKPPFQLPTYITDTGIATQRDAIKEKEADASLKQKTRERVQPKMGKIDIDYQKLHDAFFKFQVPDESMTSFGQMYYEGKEFETNLQNKRPGELSKELVEALSIPPLAPPPWLIAQQRFGPPPSYPSLQIPGLNAPIPKDAQWGFHPGGWGKPPVDEFQRPLYGDVFGLSQDEQQGGTGEEYEVPVEKEYWGQMEPDQEEEEESEEEEEDEDEDMGEMDVDSADAAGMQTPSGLATPSGYASTASTVPGGMETPDFMDLRKRRDGTESVQPEQGPPRELYQVVQERQGSGRGGFLGSDRTYDLSNMPAHQPEVLGGREQRRSKKRGDDGVDLALDPAELEGMSESELRQKYEAQQRRNQSSGTSSVAHQDREDFSDFVAQEVAKKRARAAGRAAGGSGRDKGKEREKFKF